VAFILAESNNKKAVGKIKNFLHKWRPLRQALPGVEAELALLGMARGPKFDKVIKAFFAQQLEGRARKAEEHEKLLRKLAGIKEPPKKKVEKEKRKKLVADLSKRTPSQKPPVAEAEAPAKVATPAVAAKSAAKPAAKKAAAKKPAKKPVAKKKAPAKKSTKKSSKKKSGKR
jgi:hypothetical protein